jgi:hypothetical protein
MTDRFRYADLTGRISLSVSAPVTNQRIAQLDSLAQNAQPTSRQNHPRRRSEVSGPVCPATGIETNPCYNSVEIPSP